MASHYPNDNIIQIHRMVALPVKTLDDIVREAPEAHPDLIDELREHGIFDGRSLLERLGDFFESDRGTSYILGFYSGCMLTVAAALLSGFAR